MKIGKLLVIAAIFFAIYKPVVAEKAVNEPPQNISTKVTVGDQPFTTAIFVKLYVPYATKPNIKPV